MIKIAVVGLGKMGLSHYAIVNAHPDVELAAVCDSSGYVLGVLKKYTGVTTYSDFDAMLRRVRAGRRADRDALAAPTRRWSGRRSSAACTSSARSRSRSSVTDARRR